MRKKGLYLRLAKQNIKAHYRTYVPYLLASIGITMMFFMVMNLASDRSLTMSSLSEMLGVGVYIIAIFSFVFILYINSFLVKQRMKEFGLYNILGMEKKHISRVMMYEALITYVLSMTIGIGLGMVFSKLMQMLLLRMIRYSGNLTLTFTSESFLYTVVLFAVIQILAYAGTLAKIHISRPIDLLKAGSQAEAAPKVNWLLAVLGFIFLGIGYWMAITTENPAMAASLFLVAAIFVMLGTYCLFTAGSAAVLKILQKNKKYYYQRNHFINISGMMYRMKQNAKGLASICILSCMVIVTISVTMGLYVGTDAIIKSMYPQQIQVTAYAYTQDDIQAVDTEIDTAVKEKALNRSSYSWFSVYLHHGDEGYVAAEDSDTAALIVFYDIDDYNRLNKENVQLKDNSVLIYDSAGYADSDISIYGYSYDVQEILKTPAAQLHEDIYDNAEDQMELVEVYVNDLFQTRSELGMDDRFILYKTGFDYDGSEAEQAAVTDQISTDLFQSDLMDGTAYCVVQQSQSYFTSFGSIFFIGMFLGAIFLMATVLIIYYKQISEGYEDRGRYRILQQVGMSRNEVKKTINSQVLTVFFLPLIVALVHMIVAFPMLTRMIRVFNLNDTVLFLKCVLFTTGIFAAIYALIYWITSRTYFHIVEQKSISEVRE